MKVFSGKTSCILNLSASDGFFNLAHYMLNVSKDEYGEQNYRLGASIDIWYGIGNIFLSGVFGWFIYRYFDWGYVEVKKGCCSKFR